MLYKGRFFGVQALARYSLLPAVDLVRECAFSTETRAWEELVRRFRPAITSAVLRAAERWCDPTPQLRDDLIQDTYFKICNHNCRMLRSFRPNHHNSIYGFLQVVAVNVVHDHFKAERSSTRNPGPTEPISAQTTLEPGARASADRLERRLRLRHIAEVLGQVAAGPDYKRNRIIFFLHYHQGMTANEIAALPSVRLTAKGVESILFRLTRMIRSHINRESVARLAPKSGEAYANRAAGSL